MKKFFILALALLTLCCSLTACLMDTYAQVTSNNIVFLGETTEGGWYFLDEGDGYGNILLMKEGVPINAGEFTDTYEGICEQHDENVIAIIVGGKEYVPFVDENGIGLDPLPQH